MFNVKGKTIYNNNILPRPAKENNKCVTSNKLEAFVVCFSIT